MSEERKMIISGESAKEFFLMPFHEMRKVLTFMGHMTHEERILACWHAAGSKDLTIVITDKTEAYKRWEKKKRPSLRKFSPQKRRGENCRFESSST